MLPASRLRWAVLHGTRITRKCAVDKALVPSASQLSKAEFYGTRDVMGRALSAAVLKLQVHPLGTLLYQFGCFVFVFWLFCWLFFEGAFCNCRLDGLGPFMTLPLEAGLTE